MYKKTAIKRSTVVLRSMSVMLIIMLLAAVGVYFMGEAYVAMEKTAFNRDTKAFEISNDNIVFFGEEYSVPLGSTVEKITDFFENHCPAIIKLLITVQNSFKEFIYTVINWF